MMAGQTLSRTPWQPARATVPRRRSWFGSKTRAIRKWRRGASLLHARGGACDADAHAGSVGLPDIPGRRVVCRLGADQPDPALAGGQDNTLAARRMKRALRSAGVGDTPSWDPRFLADGAAARPASGHAETDRAGRKHQPSGVRLTDWRSGYNSHVNENMARPRAGYPDTGGQYHRIRTLLVSGPCWLARRWGRSPAGVSGAGSADHRGSGMYREDVVRKSADAPAGGGARVDRTREASRSASKPADAGAVQVGQPAANFLEQGCARLAERIRASAGVTIGDDTSDQRAAGTPWLGLMLWFCACAGLFVSLIVGPDELERDHRVAARSSAQPPIEDHPYRAPGLTGHASEVSLIAPPRLPPRWAAD
jgi:hypothetical protein